MSAPARREAPGHPDPRQEGLVLSTDPKRMDVDRIHRYLSEESYWARGIPRDVVARSVENSLCFGVFDGDLQVALARVITDKATFAYLCDVYVLEAYRGRGVAHWMLDAIDAHPELRGLRRWSLLTRDAHALYAAHGWTSVTSPEWYMERSVPKIYLREADAPRSG